jgi:hypothetical protein
VALLDAVHCVRQCACGQLGHIMDMAGLTRFQARHGGLRGPS